MRLLTLTCCILVCSLAAASEIPHLRKQAAATQLIVDGKPFLALGGELLNSSATSLEYMKPVWPQLAAAKLNTVLAGVSWNQIEPQEGKFNFTVLDGIIQAARTYHLRLVLLWFGTWKNGLSGYPPDWVKKDIERFPRAQIVGGSWPVFGGTRYPVEGSRNIELLSPLGDASRDADARAFAALMRHVKAVDGQQRTVIMIQVENEVGMQGDTRDRSPLANKAFEGPVPKELMDYVEKRKDTLIPVFRKMWETSGFKTSGTWEEVFGKGRPTDEVFMSWYFARYIDVVIAAGKAEYPIPMFTNSPQTGFGRAPSRGQGGGPMPDAMDVWRAGGPRIDALGGDMYSQNFVGDCIKYTQSGNPLVIPETNGGTGSGTKALYAFGAHDAILFSPFAIERWAGKDLELSSAYDLLARLTPLMLAHQGNGTMSAVRLGPKDPPQKVQVGSYTLEASFLIPPGSSKLPVPQETLPPAAAIFIATGPDEYIVAGTAVKVVFTPNTPGPPLVGLGTVEEGTFVNGRWVAGRQFAGDDTDQGNFLGLWAHWKSLGWPVDATEGQNLFLRDMSIQRVTLYRYR